MPIWKKTHTNADAVSTVGECLPPHDREMVLLPCREALHVPRLKPIGGGEQPIEDRRRFDTVFHRVLDHVGDLVVIELDPPVPLDRGDEIGLLAVIEVVAEPRLDGLQW